MITYFTYPFIFRLLVLLFLSILAPCEEARLPPLGVVGATDEVVQADVEEVGEGDELLIGRFTCTIFIPLVSHLSHSY